MVKDTYQIPSGAAEIYESQKIPSMFRPLAQATLNRLPTGKSDVVLDVACGTGIVGRLLRETHPEVKRIAGVDLNQGMIDVARNLTKGDNGVFEWVCADVAKMPFSDNEFSLAICQQGLQFFPDRKEALEEIRRVTISRGKLALTVWNEISPLFTTLAEALKANVSDKAAVQSMAPFEFRDLAEIKKLLEAAGYRDIRADTLVIDRVIGPAKDSIPREIMGNPVGAEVSKKGTEAMENIVLEVESKLQPYRTPSGFTVPHSTFLVEAVA